MSECAPRTDLLIAGGGLAGGLIARALARARPDVRVTLVEAGPRLGGNHLWSFFDADLDEAGQALVAPLVGHRWQGYDVAFPAYRRTLAGAYNSIESERFDAVLRTELADVRTGCAVAALDPAGATLADGTRIEAAGVIDARGFHSADTRHLGWQKFAGQLLRLTRPHNVARPLLMDATVDQSDGYRFVYVLPFGPEHLFVEDTYYTPEPDLDVALLTGRIQAYAARQGWEVAAVERAEAAALPIAMGGTAPAAGPVAQAGMAAQLFHPMTGYSLPDAVRTALLVANLPDLTSASLARTLHGQALRTWQARGFYRMLAALMFRAAEAPETRYRTFEHFYRMGEDRIARFYAARSTPLDKARILIGRPPVPIGRALAVIAGRA